MGEVLLCIVRVRIHVRRNCRYPDFAEKDFILNGGYRPVMQQKIQSLIEARHQLVFVCVCSAQSQVALQKFWNEGKNFKFKIVCVMGPSPKIWGGPSHKIHSLRLTLIACAFEPICLDNVC